ncbi:MAG: hypothetical protein RLZZ195_296 [Pseudomonadota bacterium]|jgi:hypothetical protein|uniref:hypothetical protein n=1 Tax=Candidatus Fonsibacter ubiquis TaxID=1925548 RepID=UPI00195ABADE|nr:hypothetical protein [Candidatus Fonsibacter ubiquis]
MKKLMVMIVGMFLISSTAFAKMCPKLWAQFDTDVKTTKASAADVTKAKALRAEGEKLHKAGTHDKSEKALKDALKLIGSKV